MTCFISRCIIYLYPIIIIIAYIYIGESKLIVSLAAFNILINDVCRLFMEVF